MKKLLRRPDGLICKDICEILYKYGMTIDFFDRNVNRGNFTFWDSQSISYRIKHNLPVQESSIFKDERTDFNFYWNEQDNQYICYRNDIKGLLITLTWWGISPHISNYIALNCYKNPSKLEEHLKQFKAVYNPLDIGLQSCEYREKAFDNLESFCEHYAIQKTQLLERLANGWNLQDAIKVRKDFEESLNNGDIDFKLTVIENGKRYKDIYDLTKSIGIKLEHFTENAVRLGFNRAIYLRDKDYTEFSELHSIGYKWLPAKTSWIGTNQIWTDHLENEYKTLKEMCNTYKVDVLQFIDMLNAGADIKYVFGGYTHQYIEFFGRPRYSIYFWNNKKYYQIVGVQAPLGVHSKFVPTWLVKIRNQ